MNRQTIVVHGPLAYRMRRFDAAKEATNGVEIFTLPLLAARLAGGFLRPALSQEVDPLIRSALETERLSDLESVKTLPGMTMAVQRALRKAWQADLSLASVAQTAPRLADLLRIEQHIRAGLPSGVLLPADLRDRALANVEHARKLLGDVVLHGILDIPQVWRPLIGAIARVVPTSWDGPGLTDRSWFAGAVSGDLPNGEINPSVVSCANPRAEVVEALRWVRELVASGRARPSEIGICATDPGTWDQHFLVLSRQAGLPIHFSHGVPALATIEGQSCAALADVLLRGLSLDRVRRLIGHVSGSTALKGLPKEWAAGLNDGAALFDVAHWNRAFEESLHRGLGHRESGTVLLPVLELLAKGAGTVATDAGSMLLGSKARDLWSEALRRASPQALEFSLRNLHVDDGHEPATSVVWCPAEHLANAPRKFVRLIGLASRSWPRDDSEDPLLPSHVVSEELMKRSSFSELDRLSFAVITKSAEDCTLSFSRRDSQGKHLTAGTLLARDVKPEHLRQDRIPRHAYSEADRLLARPGEAMSTPSHQAAAKCWRDWQHKALTGHDGWIRSNHPAILSAIARTHSATSLRFMLRDPLAFVWRYALGWRWIDDEDRPLALDDGSYGELVHELLKLAVDNLEPEPGYARAERSQIEAAVDDAAESIRISWPPKRSVPPALLWTHVLAAAKGLAIKALTLDPRLQPDTRSWTEVPFGVVKGAEGSSPDLPWDPTSEVRIPDTDFHLQGKIDRVDIRSDGAVRVSDYKTGKEPENVERMVVKGGTELQRVIYAIAVRQLVPHSLGVVSRLLYLTSDQPREHRLPNVAEAISDVASYASAAAHALRKGLALPGPTAQEEYNPVAIALPAMRRVYLQRKGASINQALGEFVEVWRSR